MAGAQEALSRAGARELLLVAAVGLFLGLIGPFGSYFAGAAPLRIAYWTGAVLAGALLFGTAASTIAARRMALRPTILMLLAATLFLALPFAALVSLAAPRLMPATASLRPLDWYLQVLAVACPLVLLGFFASRRSASGGSKPRPAAAPALLGADAKDILCLQMEDHYVRVHTSLGHSLLLMRMRDAVAELGRLEGAQVHRSWWVAREAVASVEREGRRASLTLTNGLRVPVSRERRDVLPDWLVERIG